MRSRTNIEGICSSAITKLPYHKLNFREHGYKAVSKNNSKTYNLNNSWDITSLLWQLSKIFPKTIKITTLFHESCVVWIYVFFYKSIIFFPPNYICSLQLKSKEYTQKCIYNCLLCPLKNNKNIWRKKSKVCRY